MVDAWLQVVLPEGTASVEPHVPLPGVELSWGVKHTYLDTSGRPVVVLRKQHVVPDHDVQLRVSYAFPSLSVLHEPLLLVAGA